MDIKEDKHLIAIAIIASTIVIISSIFVFSEVIFGNTKTKSTNTDNRKTVTFVGVGDNLMHDTIYVPADGRAGVYGDGVYDFDSFYKNIKDDISKFDLRYINQESIIAGNSFGISSYPKFNSPQPLMDAVVDAGFNVINMANNHSLDRGETGINNSIKLWNSKDVYHFGVYDSQESRNKTHIIEKNGIKIAVLSYTYGTNGMLPVNNYAVAYLNEKDVRRDIENARNQSDFILISVHWGEEGIEQLDSIQQKYGNLFSELGVDVVLGTHAHRIQKVEWKENSSGKKTLIYYGTGNFVHNMLKPTTYLEGMASWTFVKDGSKKYIDNAKFTPLVFHLERGAYGFEGSVYRLDEYPIELANKHIEMCGNGSYYLNIFKNTVDSLVPKEMIDMK